MRDSGEVAQLLAASQSALLLQLSNDVPCLATTPTSLPGHAGDGAAHETVAAFSRSQQPTPKTGWKARKLTLRVPSSACSGPPLVTMLDGDAAVA